MMARDVKHLKFGANIHTSIQPGVDPVTEARHAEQLGFDLVTLHGDVLHGSDPSFELWTLLCWVAASTSRIRVAPVVLALPNRHPAVLAKMAETLDRLCDGRLVLVLGAGGPMNEPAYRAFGLAQRTPSEEVARQLAAIVGHGFTFVNLWPSGEATMQRERLARDLLPAVHDLIA
jgi:alkanesulfonate monooxygenase SsuD/methylene tetrahydromethanopterin reductase-like flavin-dependent oxidoreductase (luciferase family)